MQEQQTYNQKVNNLIINIMATEEKKYIIPTKDSPVFSAYCDWFGRIEDGPINYKEWIVVDTIGHTFAISFKDAVNFLHEWIQDNKSILDEYPKSKFSIEMITGEIDQRGDNVYKSVYSITARKAKRLLL